MDNKKASQKPSGATAPASESKPQAPVPVVAKQSGKASKIRLMLNTDKFSPHETEATTLRALLDELKADGKLVAGSKATVTVNAAIVEDTSTIINPGDSIAIVPRDKRGG